MSLVMVTWWTAGSLGTLGTPRNQTLRHGCMVMASVVRMCRSLLLIGQKAN